MRLLPALVLSGLSAATVMAAETDARSRIEPIMARLDALLAVDLGYCEHEHADFEDAYRALIESPPPQNLKRAADAFGLKSNPPKEVDHEPSRESCFAALNKAKGIFDEHARFLQQLAEDLPPSKD